MSLARQSVFSLISERKNRFLFVSLPIIVKYIFVILYFVKFVENEFGCIFNSFQLFPVLVFYSAWLKSVHKCDFINNKFFKPLFIISSLLFELLILWIIIWLWYDCWNIVLKGLTLFTLVHVVVQAIKIGPFCFHIKTGCHKKPSQRPWKPVATINGYSVLVFF